MDRRLRARGIKVIVYDDDIPLRSIHLTPEGHAMIAAALLPRVMAILELRGAVNGHSTVAGSRKSYNRKRPRRASNGDLRAG